GGSHSGGGSSTGNKTPGAPNTAIMSLRGNKKARKATLKFRGSHGVGKLSFKGKLDHGKWGTCHPPKNYKHLQKGTHTIQAKGVDHRGKVAPPAATKRFKV